MAAILKRELGVDVELERGSRGEFTVWVGDSLVAKKGFWAFPKDAEVLEAVRTALGGAGPADAGR